MRCWSTLAALVASIAISTAARAPAASTGVIGTVRYYDGQTGMPAVSVALTGATQSMATTGGDGSYVFSDPGAGNWLVAPSKMGGATAMVTTQDAACALAAAVGGRQLDGYQLLAADVTGDGRVTALDSARILQLLAGARAHLPVADVCGSDWAFIPAAQTAPNQQISAPRTVPACAPGAIAYAPLTSMAQGQDFLALAFGDCTAQLRTAPTATTTARSTATATPTATPTYTATPVPTRDWRTWPFTAARRGTIRSAAARTTRRCRLLAQLPIGFNYEGAGPRRSRSRRRKIRSTTFLFRPSWGPQRRSWAFFDRRQPHCGNSASVEPRSCARRRVPPPPTTTANYYSTVSTANDHMCIAAGELSPREPGLARAFLMPAGACPSPDSDGLMAVFQPDGWVIDIYAGVVLSSGEVMGTMASWIDARGDGTGWWNGRRASMLPSFAGLIRKGEIADGRIPHALAMQLPKQLLKREAVWPAYAFDRDSGYSGTVPMGALLAIPPSVDMTQLGLSTSGSDRSAPRRTTASTSSTAAATAAPSSPSTATPTSVGRAQREPAWWKDLEIIRDHLSG